MILINPWKYWSPISSTYWSSPSRFLYDRAR